MARAAEKQVNTVVAAREAAFKEARRPPSKDRRQYQVMAAVSGALGSRIVTSAAELAKGKHPPHGTGEMVRRAPGGHLAVRAAVPPDPALRQGAHRDRLQRR